MKITQKAIENVISELVGDDIIPLVNLLKTNKNISEFQIASKIKIPVDITRNQLYRLYNNNLVTFIRKKDKQKGWYIYYWTLNIDRIKYLVTDLKKKRIERLKDRLYRENNNHFFSCLNECIRIDFEQATNMEYKCPECGELLQQENNLKKIEFLKEEIKQLEIEISKEQKIIESENKEDVIEENNIEQKSIKKVVKEVKKKVNKKKNKLKKEKKN
jgi:transcription initiation factor TFIIE subunit alpha